MDARKLGRILKAELVRRGIRQRDIAKRLNLDPKFVSRQLNGYGRPHFFVIMGIIHELGLNAHAIYIQAYEDEASRD